MSKTAVILAGGKGSRLKPYTISIPKPLVPIGDTPILELIINRLKHFGYNKIIITVNHLADVIKAYFGDGKKWGVNIEYSYEEKPLSTMGPIKMLKNLPEDFLVMNGDVLTDIDFKLFFDQHKINNKIFTIAAQKRNEKIDYGVLEKDTGNNLIGFTEKPTYSFLVSMGIYYLKRETLEFIPENEFFGFDHLMAKLINSNKLPFVYEYDGYWLDIGRPADYEEAIRYYTNKNNL
jgi:NDP-mannose synthase